MIGALIVVDMQNDYLWDKRKTMFNYDSDALVAAVNSSIKKYSAEGYDIIYLSQIFQNIITNRKLIGFSIENTPGAELYGGLDIVSDLRFDKHLPDSFTSLAFKKYAKSRNFENIVICGLDLCGCVGATAKGALKTGAKVSIIDKSTGCRFPKEKELKNRRKLQGYGVKFI